jgi:hypothetical protein
MRIDDIALVGVEVEFAASVGAEIKAHSPYPHTLLLTMVDGAAKYMADAKSYDQFTYEARNSILCPWCSRARCLGNPWLS